MKITFIIPGMGMRISGGVKIVFELANRLIEKGHEVSIVYPLVPLMISSKLLDPRSAALQIGGAMVNVVRGNKAILYNFEGNLIRTPSLHPNFVRFFEDKIPDADIVVATTWETAYSVSKLSERKGEKFYFVQHYEIWNVWNEDNCWRAAEKIENDPTKLCLAMADVIPKTKRLKELKNLVDETYKLPLNKITISTWLRDLLEKKFNEKVEDVIILGVDFDTFYEENDGSKDRRRILTFYRRERWRGMTDAIRAFEIVRKRHPEVQFVMFGARKGKDVPDYVEFHKKPSNSELRKLYSTSDIFVLPSWVEGCQAPPIEAMACKCAVVCTNVGGVPDYTVPGETALVSPPRDPNSLAQNIIKILEDEEMLRHVSEAGSIYIKQFTLEKATIQLERIFERYAKVYK
jgi:glycosyltransferase involved in cell wall biosynthesis